MQEINLVTGGSSGLGLELSKKLVREGEDVCIVSRSEERLERAAGILQGISDKTKIKIIRANVGIEKDVLRIFETVEAEGIRIKRLFNNAGLGLYGIPEKNNREMIDRVFEANLTGLIQMSSRAVIHMKNHGGSIINIMSTAALTGKANETVYCAAKWGARGFTEALKAYTRDSDIYVVSVYPSGIDTPFWTEESGMFPDVSRFMKPEDAAGIIVDACRNINSAYVSDIVVNRSSG